MKMNDPLLDVDFLRELSLNRERELFARIIALDIDENTIEQIQGRITQGSVPVDGKSLVRRTCSLTLIADELNIQDYIWGIETKIKLEIGLTNNIKPEYPSIIWFKMGTYILTMFNISRSASGFTISLQGKDKMCLLNGDIGGALTALTYDFGTMKVINKYGAESTEKIPIKHIITKAVHDFAKEPYQNIIVNDLDDCGLELMEYRGEDPMYLIYNMGTIRNGAEVSGGTQQVENVTIHQSFKMYTSPNCTGEITIEAVENDIKERTAANKAQQYIFKSLNELDVSQDKVTAFYNPISNEPNNKVVSKFCIIKIEYGMTCGYRNTELVYAGDLTSSVGEPITSMLNKIVSMLGDYEFFYNLDGQFVFQRKRTYLQTSWNSIQGPNNGEKAWADNAAYTASSIFSFEDGTLITSYQNTPNLANVRNDFSIWGQRTTTSGTKLPIHYRYAIDKKPLYYTTYDGVTYTTMTEKEHEIEKERYALNISGGYQKEPSRFGLSEDWWEIRDWAKAWVYSGLDIPTEQLRNYCPTRAILYSSRTTRPEGSATSEPSEINAADWDQYGYASRIHVNHFTTDDMVFNEAGQFTSSHGSCAHAYTWWLQQFEPGGQYAGGYAYFYKPTVPKNADGSGSQVTLKIGDQIHFAQDWRELIYQMALDFNKHGDEDDFLTTIGENNSTFYPTGITGYEQYYIDVVGFWRDLYNPEYKHSYTSVSLTEEEFNNIYSPYNTVQYYYETGKFISGKEEPTFYPNAAYYQKNDYGEYDRIFDLSETDFVKNPGLYFIRTSTEIKAIPSRKEKFSQQREYYKLQDGKLTSIKMTKSIYENTKDLLLYKDEQNEYSPCYTVKKFLRGKSYYLADGSTAFSATEEEYNANPLKYYELALSDNKTETVLKSCVTMDPYDSSKTYAIKNNNTGTFTWVDIKQVEYENTIRTDLYRVKTITSYKPCTTPAVAFDSTALYYVEDEIQEYDMDPKALKEDGVTQDFNNPDNPNLYWKKGIFDAPESLDFWFDMLDSDGDLSQFSNKAIGNRPKAVNDQNVKAIYFRDTPEVIFTNNLAQELDRKSGYTYVQIPSYYEYLFTISSQGKSAKDVLDSYLYEYSHCAEFITVQAIPVYYLEPNTRIIVRDEESHINGEYIITKINFPLDINGTMSINAVKVVDRIY